MGNKANSGLGVTVMEYAWRFVVLAVLSWFVLWLFLHPDLRTQWTVADFAVCLPLAILWQKWSVGRLPRD